VGQISAAQFPAVEVKRVTVFDCLHDMGDPVGAASHVRDSLSEDGTWMIVEPFAHDELKDNLNPVGRVYYSFSTLLCTPCSRSQEIGLCLGAQSGEKRIRVVRDALSLQIYNSEYSQQEERMALRTAFSGLRLLRLWQLVITSLRGGFARRTVRSSKRRLSWVA